MGCAGVPKPDVPNAVKWNGHWYAVLPPANWDAAKQKCEQLGGHIAYVETESEHRFITELAKNTPERVELQAVWLGGSDEKSEGEWFWLNGKPIKTNFWHEGEPNNQGGGPGEDYLWLEWSTGTWNDVHAGYEAPVVCEWE